MLQEKEVHKTIQCEGLRVKFFNSVDGGNDFAVTEKSKGKDSPSGKKKSKAMDFVVKQTFFHDWLSEGRF